MHVKEYPQTTLGISNSQGSVLSAIVADTETLEQATTKFIVATAVPDLMQAEQPVVACSSTPASKDQGHGHETDVRPTRCQPHDGCIDVYCLTVTGGQPPHLKSSLLHNNIITVPVVGYIACGARWFEYVDLDDAFAVMASTFPEHPDCFGPPSDCDKALNKTAVRACWLKAEDMLQRESSGIGFTCA